MRTCTIAASTLLIVLLGGPLPGDTVSWTSGTSGPSTWSITPASPTAANILSFQGPLNVPSYTNKCAAETALGGTPQIAVNNANRVIDITFNASTPSVCTKSDPPVCGLQGTFGPLSAGKWSLRCTTLNANLDFSVAATSGHGSIYYVDHNSPGPVRDGTTWATAFLSLQDALAIPGTGNEIHIADGAFQPDQGTGQTAGDRTATFNVQNGTIIKGGYAGYGASNPDARDINLYPTILTGDLLGDDPRGISNRSDNSYHVVTISGDAKLDGLTIQSGQADGPYPHFYGGGLYVVGGRPIVSRCTIRANTALYGGGVGTVASSVYFANCNFSGNQAYVFGGGIHNEDSATTLVNCLMTGNAGGSSGVGGGSAISNIGGLAAYTVIDNCTLADNTGPDQLGIVVMNFSLPGAMTAVTINNSIIYDNGVNGSIWTNNTTQVAANFSILQGGWTGPGNLDADPLFVQQGSWSVQGQWIDTGSNYGLQAGSPAIDAGMTTLLPADVADVDNDGNTVETIPIDLAGTARVQGPAVDMGAYEYSRSGGSTWQTLWTSPLTVDVPSSGYPGPVALVPTTLTYSGTLPYKANLMLDIVPVPLTGGNWKAEFSPGVTTATVGPGSFTVSFTISGTNVGVQVLTPGATNVTLANVTLYSQPAP